MLLKFSIRPIRTIKEAIGTTNIQEKDRKGIESNQIHSYPSMTGFLSRISLALWILSSEGNCMADTTSGERKQSKKTQSFILMYN